MPVVWFCDSCATLFLTRSTRRNNAAHGRRLETHALSPPIPFYYESPLPFPNIKKKNQKKWGTECPPGWTSLNLAAPIESVSYTSATDNQLSLSLFHWLGSLERTAVCIFCSLGLSLSLLSRLPCRWKQIGCIHDTAHVVQPGIKWGVYIAWTAFGAASFVPHVILDNLRTKNEKKGVLFALVLPSVALPLELHRPFVISIDSTSSSSSTICQMFLAIEHSQLDRLRF